MKYTKKEEIIRKMLISKIDKKEKKINEYYKALAKAVGTKNLSLIKLYISRIEQAEIEKCKYEELEEDIFFQRYRQYEQEKSNENQN